MATRKIDPTVAARALEAVGAHLANPRDTERPARSEWANATRFLLGELAERVPGRAVEVRVPPYGAVQILTGTTHRRGTPPAVVEMSGESFLALALGHLTWSEAVSRGLINASGERADLSALFPMDIAEAPTPPATER